jgi:Flp pilus assembly pilin Flp
MHTPETADPADPATAHARTALRRLHVEDDGAQAMEYAALAGGGATVVGLILSILRSEPVQERIRDFLSGVFEALADNVLNLL